MEFKIEKLNSIGILPSSEVPLGGSFVKLNNYMGNKPAHFPKTTVQAAYNKDSIIIRFHVEDRFVKAEIKEYQGPVYEDSCVEFFFTPGTHLGTAYFNLEMNCIGNMLFNFHPDKNTSIKITHEDASLISVNTSLPRKVFPENHELLTWSLIYRLPFDLILNYVPNALLPSSGKEWKANFYKCADGSSHPHWLTWTKVNHRAPNFHLPEFFGKLRFK